VKPDKAAILAQARHRLAASGQDLVGIGLMADIPDQLVARGVENGMECDGQLDHAQCRAQMPAGRSHFGNGIAPEFVGKPDEIRIA
jgi:hypothetical protein